MIPVGRSVGWWTRLMRMVNFAYGIPHECVSIALQRNCAKSKVCGRGGGKLNPY